MISRLRYQVILHAAMLFINDRLMGLTYSPAVPFHVHANSILVATDEKGHAIAAYNALSSSKIYAYYYSNNTWNLLYLPDCPLGTVTGLMMHSEGTGLLTYIEDTTNDLRSLYFNGSDWTVPALNPIDTGIDSGGDLAMNADGHAVVVWSDGSTDIRVNIFANGAWGTASNPGDIGTGTNPLVGINISDELVVGFVDVTDVLVNVFTGGVWSGTTIANTDAFVTGVGIDDNSNSIVLVRENTSGDIIAYNFIGGSLNNTSTLNPGTPDPTYTGYPVLGMTSFGSAVAAWNYSDFFNGIYGLYYSQFDGSNWNTTVEFQSGSIFTDPAISLNTNGDTLFFWGNEDSFIYTTAYLPFGSAMDAPTDVASAGGTPRDCAVSLADTGFNALAWVDGGEGNHNPFGMGLSLLPAPTGLSISSCSNRQGDGQRSCINSLAWNYSDDINIASYNILKDGVLYDNVPVNDPQTYTDTDAICGQRTVYTVEGVDQDGIPGYQTSITLN